MTRIESPVVALSAAPELVARDFQDWNTFGELLGAGPVSDFSSEGDTCTFKVTGGVAIHLLRTSDNSATTGTVLTLVTQAPTPVKFNLEVNVQPNGDDENAPVVKVRSTANLKTEAKKPAQLVGLGAFKSLVGSDYFASGVCAHCNHEKQTHVDGQ